MKLSISSLKARCRRNFPCSPIPLLDVVHKILENVNISDDHQELLRIPSNLSHFGGYNNRLGVSALSKCQDVPSITEAKFYINCFPSTARRVRSILRHHLQFQFSLRSYQAALFDAPRRLPFVSRLSSKCHVRIPDNIQPRAVAGLIVCW